MARIEVVLGDITRQTVDAIVTAANESLLGGGGADGAIHRAAGRRLAEAGSAIAPRDSGDAKATPAFDLELPVRHVVYTVGPVREGGDYGEVAVLASCCRRSLQVIDQLGAHSVAFPAIVTGIYGFPPERAARIAVHTIALTPTNVTVVRLVAWGESAQVRIPSTDYARSPGTPGEPRNPWSPHRRGAGVQARSRAGPVPHENAPQPAAAQRLSW